MATRTVTDHRDPAVVARKERRRAALERVVEKALERLDRLDGDPDLEPSLGASEHPSHWTARDFAWTDYANRHDPPQPPADDREEDADLEPSLGSLGLHANSDQRSWSNGGTDDLEGCEHDGREPDVDAEPDSDAEPDFDGEGTPNPAWTINGRDHWRVHGAAADVLLDPDETGSPGAPQAEVGMSS